MHQPYSQTAYTEFQKNKINASHPVHSEAYTTMIQRVGGAGIMPIYVSIRRAEMVEHRSTGPAHA